ncbi:MAG: cytochrome c peroxidase, partial [Planctomycetota bacterium]
HAESLSRSGDMSCATCHALDASLADDRDLGYGVADLERHTIALWNVAHQRWFFWDGRADSLWSQALAPLEDPLEHAFTRSEVARTIQGDPELRGRYEAVFGALPADFEDTERFPRYARPVPEHDRALVRARERAQERTGTEGGHGHANGRAFYHPHQRAWDRMTEEDQELVNEVFVRAGKSIAAFERRFTSIRSDFDVFVEGLRTGDDERLAALSPDARRGFELFVGKARCVSCHGGPLFTDLEFHDTRVPHVDGAREDDPGRSVGIARVLEAEFGVRTRWSDAREGNPVAKVEFLPRPGVDGHAHGFIPEFKTPSLRNVAETAPYMHNGAFETLEEVVEFYDTRANVRPSNAPGERILEPLGLTEEERSDLVAFLESLTDDYLDMGRVGPPER